MIIPFKNEKRNIIQNSNPLPHIHFLREAEALVCGQVIVPLPATSPASNAVRSLDTETIIVKNIQ